MHLIKNICVYCASSSKIDSSYIQGAYELGKLLAENNIKCICGGGNQGLMGNLIDGVLDNKGNVLGVIPRFMHDEGWYHKYLSELIITQTMHERKEIMAQKADAVIALPGGCGTMEELLEVITWKQLGLFCKPIVILNINNYYDPLIQMLSQAIKEHFMREKHAQMWNIANTPKEAIIQTMNFTEWDEDARKFAAI